MLPVSFWSAALCSTSLFAQSADVPGSVLRGHWQQLAVAAVTPAYSWASRPVLDAPDMRGARTGLAAELFFPLRDGGAVRALTLSDESSHGLRRVGEGTRWQRERAQRLGNLQLREQVLAPALSADLGSSTVTVEAILVHQQYASHALGVGRRTLEQGGMVPFIDGATGSGVALTYESRLGDGLSAYASVRSPVDMDPVQQHRGIYADPGQFDLPGGVGMGLTRSIGAGGWVQLGVERVLYSDVDTFSSRSLPTRFIALLGDSTSPSFDWQDLTVYSAAVGYRSQSEWWWELRYSTQQQPEPTSPLLSRVLEDQYSDRNFAFGIGRATSQHSQLQLVASYAAREYFLGSPTVANFSDGGEQIELEARWQVSF